MNNFVSLQYNRRKFIVVHRFVFECSNGTGGR